MAAGSWPQLLRMVAKWGGLLREYQGTALLAVEHVQLPVHAPTQPCARKRSPACLDPCRVLVYLAGPFRVFHRPCLHCTSVKEATQHIPASAQTDTKLSWCTAHSSCMHVVRIDMDNKGCLHSCHVDLGPSAATHPHPGSQQHVSSWDQGTHLLLGDHSM